MSEDDERARLTRALIQKDQIDTAEMNRKDLEKLAEKRKECAQRYNKNVAAVLLREEERATLDRTNARIQAQEARELQRWDVYHSGDPIQAEMPLPSLQLEQKPTQPDHKKQINQVQQSTPVTPDPYKRQDQDFDRAAALLEKHRQRRDEREQGHDYNGQEY